MAVPCDMFFTAESVICSEPYRLCAAVGIDSAMQVRKSRLQHALLIIVLKLCSLKRAPPQKKHIPALPVLGNRAKTQPALTQC